MKTATKSKVVKFRGKPKSKNALAVVAPPKTTMQLISEAARDPKFDVQKFDALLAAREREMKIVAAQTYNEAMRKTQAELPTVIKTLTNTQTNSKYAPLENIHRRCMPIINANGFSLSFYEEDAPNPEKKRICVDIMHIAGHTEKKHVDLHPDIVGIKGNPNKTPIHSDGSVMSYGQRRLLSMVFNIRIAGEDDDGNQGAGEFATPNEVAEIRALLKQLNISEDAAIKKAQITSLDQIPVRTYMKMKTSMEIAVQQRGGTASK